MLECPLESTLHSRVPIRVPPHIQECPSKGVPSSWALPYIQECPLKGGGQLIPGLPIRASPYIQESLLESSLNPGVPIGFSPYIQECLLEFRLTSRSALQGSPLNLGAPIRVHRYFLKSPPEPPPPYIQVCPSGRGSWQADWQWMCQSP